MAKTARKKKKDIDPWADAIAHLRAAGPIWANLIDRVGPCRLTVRSDDRFGTLVSSIVSQQISSKAAASINARVHALGGTPHRPEALLALGEEKLRTCGLSGMKARYILNLSEAVATGRVPIHEFHTWEDDAIVASLTQVKGIGTWTAEMFLVFALGRPDVLSVGDLGIRAALKRHHDLPDLPKPHECRALTEHLRPYRSVAMWYLWEVIDNPPPS